MWPEPDETQHLLDGAEKGEAEAVNRLMERHRDTIRRLVQMRLDRKIQRRIDVSDVVQDVLIEANRRLSDYIKNPVLSFRHRRRGAARRRESRSRP